MSLSLSFTLGRSGLRVSPLSLGTMTFGTEWGWGAEREDAQRMFDRYVELGGNFIDTADIYTDGTSETWLGEFIAERGLRDAMVVASKYTFNRGRPGANAGGNGRKHLMSSVEESLRRLGTDYIDLYYVHAWDRLTPVDEVMRTLDDLVRAGKIRHVGLSDVPAWYAGRAQTLAEWRGFEPICALQMQYSLVERSIEHEFTDLATTLGMSIVPWSPLASGLLSGKYKPGETGKGRLEIVKDTGHPAFGHLNERNWPIVAELERVAAEVGRSMSQVALNWVAGRPGVLGTIIGASRIEQLEDNLSALDFELPVELRERLDAVSCPDAPFPYSYWADVIQSAMYAGAAVGDKPAGYVAPVRIGVRDSVPVWNIEDAPPGDDTVHPTT
jgi:aryl-alcohol dehydrogenase-like predicted oxidoreductase